MEIIEYSDKYKETCTDLMVELEILDILYVMKPEIHWEITDEG